MESVEKIFQFLVDNHDNYRVSIHKKMKYGYRYYYINLLVDEEPIENKTRSIFHYRQNIEICFDNRNLCVEVDSGDESCLIIEDKVLVEKWSKILEEIVSKDLEKRVLNLLENSISKSIDKNLYRELQMKKLF